MSKSSRVTKRTYYEVHFKLASPLCISSGTDNLADFDLMLDGEGKPFIPGTSIAGAFRNSLMDKKDKASVMGFSKVSKSSETEGESEQIGRMSQILISDVSLVKNSSDNVNISIRDGIKLEDNEKITAGTGKFDMQVVEPGAEGCMRFEVVERENDDEADANEKIKGFIIDLAEGNIRLGAKKNRGFGKLKVTEVGEKEFDLTQKNQAEKWLDFLGYNASSDDEGFPAVECTRYEEWKVGKEKYKDSYVKVKYAKICVPLKLKGGISIRKYSTRPGEADYEQLTIKEDEEGNRRIPVVPGSSWNGAIRGDAVRVLRDSLGCKDYKEVINDWFGTVDKDDKDRTQQSKIVISESKIIGATELPMTRVKINRFDSSAVAGALYSEISFFGGRTELEIMVRVDKGEDYKAIMGLVYLVINDIMNGFVPIGGQTAVGRGIFTGSEIKEFGNLEIDDCLASLKKYLEGRTK